MIILLNKHLWFLLTAIVLYCFNHLWLHSNRCLRLYVKLSYRCYYTNV